MQSVARIQESDRKANFCFLGDFNCHHSEWLGSSRTDSHGRSALDFSNTSGCTQLVTEATHRLGGVLDLVFTDTPGLCNVSVGSRIGRSDHSFVSVVLSTSIKVPQFCVSRLVHQKSRIQWDALEQDVQSIPWSAILRSENPVRELNGQLQTIVAARIPTVTIRVRNNDKPWFDENCRRAFDAKQTAFLRWNRTRSLADWTSYKASQRYACECYAHAQQAHKENCRARLSDAQNPHSWWKVLKETLFGKSSDTPPILSNGEMISHPQQKAELLSQYFDGKQSRDVINLPPTCHPSPKLTSLAFKAKEVIHILSKLDARGGIDPTGFFPLIFKRLSNVFAPKLSALFRTLVRNGSFPDSWRTANIVPIPKCSSPSLPSDYRPISITPVLSKVFEKLLVVRLNKHLADVIPPRQYAYRKGLGTCDALLDISSSCNDALNEGSEMLIVQIDFSAAFDRVNHAGLLYKLENAGVGGNFLKILEEYLSNRSQRVILDGQFGEPVSNVPQGSVLGPTMFLLYTADLFHLTDNDLVGYADDANLLAKVRSPRDRPEVVASVNNDLRTINIWCIDWGMSLNLKKTHAMVASRSRTLDPPFTPITLEGVIVKVDCSLTILGVTFDQKLSFESHLRTLTTRLSQQLGVLRKCWKSFGDPMLIHKCFWSFILPVVEYCSPVWASAAAGHLRLLDTIVKSVVFMSAGQVKCDLNHRRDVASLCVFYKILNTEHHPLSHFVPPPYAPVRRTRHAEAAHRFARQIPRSASQHHARSFFVRVSELWNSLENEEFGGQNLNSFKNRTNKFLLRQR